MTHKQHHHFTLRVREDVTPPALGVSVTLQAEHVSALAPAFPENKLGSFVSATQLQGTDTPGVLIVWLYICLLNSTIYDLLLNAGLSSLPFAVMTFLSLGL